MGKPHMRFVQVSDDEEMIYWYEVSREEQENMQDINSKNAAGASKIMERIGSNKT
jgi:hypothetical protein